MDTALLEDTDSLAHAIKPRLPEALTAVDDLLDQQVPYSRHAVIREAEPIVYEFTRDPGLMHQYYLLREQMFIKAWGLKHFHGKKDEFDELSDALIVRKGKMCVGGVRFVFSTPKKRLLLPMEHGGLRVKTLFPELDLENKTYGEAGRFALLPEFRAKKISPHILHLIAQEHIRQGAHYGFWIAPSAIARNNLEIFTSLGIDCKIRMDINIPDDDDYEGIKMYMGVMDFTSVTGASAPETADLETVA